MTACGPDIRQRKFESVHETNGNMLDVVNGANRERNDGVLHKLFVSQKMAK